MLLICAIACGTTMHFTYVTWLLSERATNLRHERSHRSNQMTHNRTVTDDQGRERDIRDDGTLAEPRTESPAERAIGGLIDAVERAVGAVVDRVTK
ncbi:hypothetical protein SZ64_15030 [Erythrobacter sp. SG61-1L]|nr:hypothetical protein SZ64_15030 [Erythrobacter sp. SG61-1L]